MQTLNFLFHFNDLIKLDEKEFKTKNRELSFSFSAGKDVIDVRKAREINEKKSELSELILTNSGFNEIDFLEIFLWKRNDYNNPKKGPYKTFLVTINNGVIDSFNHNTDTILLKCIQDQMSKPLKVTFKKVIMDDGKRTFGKEKVIVKFNKNNSNCQKSIDLLDILS